MPTPGPWFVTTGESDDDWSIGHTHDNGKPSPSGIAQMVWECDATLIAAAPDLLAASRKMLDATLGPRDCTHDMVGDEDICDGCAFEREKAIGLVANEMRAAIQKAEGQ